LPRMWVGLPLPGYRDVSVASTYCEFAYNDLPPIPRLDDSFNWLGAQPELAESLAEQPRSPEPTRPAAADGLLDLLAERPGVSVPATFCRFLARASLHARIRSATACYLDLGEFVVDVAGGGWLIHFLSDQQWVMHWLLYCDGQAGEAVVVSDIPFGFSEDNARHDRFDPAELRGGVVADSFVEFVYRFWIENDAWFRLAYPDEEPGLTPDQRMYVEHYAS
jgi:hypothetical protein